MAPSISYTRAAVSATPARRNLVISRIERKHVVYARSLWWWGRQGNTWSASQDENMEERLRRHQKIMRYRYSKALRRRAVWEREDSPPTWSWQMPGKWFGSQPVDRNAMSSTEQSGRRVEGQESPPAGPGGPWERYKKDFEAYKEAVDKAIERDPYGTLFGHRRLRGPASNNNSSWTAWSWIFESKETTPTRNLDTDQKAAKVLNSKVDVNNVKGGGSDINVVSSTSIGTPSPTFLEPKMSNLNSRNEPLTQTQPQATAGEGAVTDAYVYDPISGRKIPKRGTTSQQDSPTIPFLKTLFGEHGVEIPIKTYKPHKVYGYVDREGQEKSQKSKKQPEKDFFDDLANSRKLEYKKLRAATLGNSIDTAAEFGGKYEPAPEPEDKPVKSLVRASPEPDADAPLFSGTTYESKPQSSTLISGSPNASNWLVKEGFQKFENIAPAESTVKDHANRIQPALDRVIAGQANIPIKKFVPKLQSSLDRIAGSGKAPPPSPVKPPLATPVSLDVNEDKREDIDLLRASDVRASTKSARTTKQELEDTKIQNRAELEKDYARRSVSETVPPDQLSGPSEMLTKGLGSIWKHVKDYPQGVVARTMQSIGLSNEKPDLPVKVGETTTVSGEKLDIKDEHISNVASLNRKSDKVTIIPLPRYYPIPQAVATDQKLQSTKDISAKTNQSTVQGTLLTDEQAIGLAKEIRYAYELEIGKNDEEHQQVQLANATKDLKMNDQDYSPANVNSATLRTASVKPGVVRDLEMERYTTEFEPKIASLVDDAKKVKRALLETALEVESIKNERATTSVSSTVSVQGPQPPASAETTRTSSLESPYMILTYDTSLKDVQLTPLASLMGTSVASGEKINPMAAIATLNHPGAFVAHFVKLESSGYELLSGGKDVLVFYKKIGNPVEDTSNQTAVSENTGYKALRSTIAAQEAAAQPLATSEPVLRDTTSNESTPRSAAKVLDEIPADFPVPGPAVPIPPPSATSFQYSKSPKSRQRVRRQEEVFSGTRRVGQPTVTPAPEVTSSSSTDPGLFKRFVRTVRRVILTALAMGAGAYAVGVVAESFSIQEQQQRGLTEQDPSGPRKKIVMSPQRPGIFSTETTR